MPFTQWTELTEGSGFTPAGRTVAEIEPGYYDLAILDGHICFIPVHAKTDALLKFPDAATTEVIEGVRQFWARRDLYRQYGITYKRGVLLYGPPGSGKTSTLQLIARELVGMGGLVLTYNSKLFLAGYRSLRDIQPGIPVAVLMEDFEEQFNNSASKSTLLNMLDGVESLDNVVFLATTNYPEKLEPRVVNRPSRFDDVRRIPHPSKIARRIYLESLVEEGGEPGIIDVGRYADDTEGMSLAHVKELFISTVVLGIGYHLTMQRLKDMQDNKLTSLDDAIENSEPIGSFL